jgi:hypothetical protein
MIGLSIFAVSKLIYYQNIMTMDFKDQIKQISERVIKLKEQILTEEATKNAFIMPFIQCLGYDVFNPTEVVPEFISDIGLKKGEKIDYAIIREGKPAILVECKHWAQNLSVHDGQLLRYFHVSKARFGLLTNGIVYRFYSDLVAPNKMDEKPFLEFNITEIKDNQIEELKKFHKSYYDVDSIINTASELKYTIELKGLLQQELNNPSPEFVKYFAKQVYPSVVTAKVLEQFTNLTKKSVQQYISDLITERLKSALTIEKEADKEANAPLSTEVSSEVESKVVTTVDEMESFMIIKAILRNKMPVNRIFYRDAQSYFTVILDDNNRKPICRLYLGNTKKFIGLFDENKKEVKNEIAGLDDIYMFSDQILATAEGYLK